MRKMKDSGIEWIGQIPSDWDISKIKYHCSMQSGDNLTSSDIEPEGEYEVYGANGFRGYYSRFNCEGVHILVGRQGALAGNVHLVDGRYWATDHAVITKITDKTCVKFLYYSLVSADLNQYAFETAAQPGLAVSVIVNKSVPIPPLAEQQKIADFLDEKCGEIDSIRSDVQREIEILNDYKKSVITEAVTKGLNPKAKLKDSGIEWIGKIPEEWNVIRLKNASWLKGRIGWQGLRAEEFIDEGPFLITGTDFQKGVVNWDTCVHISEQRFNQDKAIQIKENDLLITKDGTIGKLAVVKNCPEKVSLNSGVFIIRNNGKYKYFDKYMYYVLQSEQFNLWFDLSNAGNSTIKHLNQENFYNFAFTYPPLSEQKAIADYLDEKCSAIDATIADKQKQLETLDEYKKSLIFEYVTGKKEVS